MLPQGCSILLSLFSNEMGDFSHVFLSYSHCLLCHSNVDSFLVIRDIALKNTKEVLTGLRKQNPVSRYIPNIWECGITHLNAKESLIWAIGRALVRSIFLNFFRAAVTQMESVWIGGSGGNVLLGVAVHSQALGMSFDEQRFCLHCLPSSGRLEQRMIYLSYHPEHVTSSSYVKLLIFLKPERGRRDSAISSFLWPQLLLGGFRFEKWPHHF